MLRTASFAAAAVVETTVFDKRDIRELDPLQLRRRAALVLQTPVLFEGSGAAARALMERNRKYTAFTTFVLLTLTYSLFLR